jgi:hypothetical protein
MTDDNVQKNIIVIKSIGFNAEIERGNIKVFSETSDGINIELINGIQLFYTNYNMPQETKRAIVAGYQTFSKAKKVVVDLYNLQKPVTILSS